MELLFDIFRIKSPSWSSSFLAGRRLTSRSISFASTNFLLINCTTAYGRVANLKPEATNPNSTKRDDKAQSNLVEHFTALLLAVFVEAGLLQVSTSYTTTI